MNILSTAILKLFEILILYWLMILYLLISVRGDLLFT